MPISIWGCSTNDVKQPTKSEPVQQEQRKEKKQEAYSKNLNQTKEWNGIDITLQQLNVSYEKDQQNLEFIVSVKNNSEKSFGIGAGEFTLKNEHNEKYKISEGDNFGGEIKKGESISGTMYFKVPLDTKKVTVMYSPDEKKTLLWDINLEKR